MRVDDPAVWASALVVACVIDMVLTLMFCSSVWNNYFHLPLLSIPSAVLFSNIGVWMAYKMAQQTLHLFKKRHIIPVTHESVHMAFLIYAMKYVFVVLVNHYFMIQGSYALKSRCGE